MSAVPVGPLLERAACGAGIPTSEMNAKLLARMIGCNSGTTLRWMTTGHLPTIKADRAAIALGWHPDAIWGAGWDLDEPI